MAIVDFTSFDDVRAALGVSQDEIKDATLSLDLYEFNLVSELEGISLDLIPTYMTQVGDPQESWNAEQTRFYQSVRLFSTYAVAKQCTISVPMFSPKEQSDGKAALVRFALDPYKSMIDGVVQQYDIFREKLESAYGAITTSGDPIFIPRTYFTVISPSSDPVTGT